MLQANVVDAELASERMFINSNQGKLIQRRLAEPRDIFSSSTQSGFVRVRSPVLLDQTHPVANLPHSELDPSSSKGQQTVPRHLAEADFQAELVQPQEFSFKPHSVNPQSIFEWPSTE
jgi:hypothetical protein